MFHEACNLKRWKSGVQPIYCIYTHDFEQWTNVIRCDTVTRYWGFCQFSGWSSCAAKVPFMAQAFWQKNWCHLRQTIPVIQIYTPIDCSQATTCSSDSTDTHGATHHRLVAGTQRDRMCDNTRNFYVVVQCANRELSFQNFLTFVAKKGTKRMITNNTNNTYMSTCTELMMIDLPSPSFTEVERSLWQWLSIAGMIWWDHSMTMWTYKYTQWRRSKRKLCINLAMVARCQEWRPMKHGIQMALAALSSSVLIV